jgi:uncharacterized protein (DUF3084 family)
MAGKPPVTKEEALGYDHDSLLADIERKKNNIITFQDTIEKEKKAIENNLYIISQIDSDHPDVKVLEANIEKKETNIKTFKDTIKNEEEEIKREKEMVRLIEENTTRGKG